MARPFGLLSAFLLTLVPLAPLPGQDDRADLLGHWPLAGDVRDHSSHGRHGEATGLDLKAAGPDGRPGAAAGFDGCTSEICVPSDAGLRLRSQEFTVALWCHTADILDDVPGDLVTKYDPATRRGFSLSLTSRAGVTHSQANVRHLHFGIDDGKAEPRWTDRGRPGNAVYIHALADHDGKLYAGTCEPGKDQAGHVYRYDGGNRWTDCGSPDRCNAISSLAVHAGKLYAGSAKYRLGGSALKESENPHAGGRVYRLEADGKWTDCGALPGREAVGGMVVYRGRLHATSLYRPAGFFRHDGETTWTDLGTANGKRVEALCPWNGQLFATGYDEGHVYRHDGKTWTDCGGLADNTQTYALCVHQGRLHVSTWRSGRVYRYQADNDWTDLGRLGEELEVMGMAVHNGKLYAGTLPLAGVYRYDGGTSWKNTGRLDTTPDVTYRRAWTMAEYQGQLFCGTLPSGHIWSMEAGRNVTYDRELSPGWHHVAAVREKDRLGLYLDGKRVAESATFEGGAFDVSNDVPLLVGFGPHDHWNGRLADVRLHGRALSSAEIERLAKR